jgi:hypothetical protein
MDSAAVIERIRRKFQALTVVMDERIRRQWAATEAIELGWGGISQVANATGISRTTILAGVRELQDQEASGASPASAPDPKTAAWWATQPEAWSACRQNLEAPAVALKRYVAWLKAFGGQPVFVGYPAAFDFSFVYWYLTEFAGENPFGYSAIDIKTYAMALLRKPYRACGKQSMPPEWFDPVRHTHVALDDAIEQGRLFCNMLKANFGA